MTGKFPRAVVNGIITVTHGDEPVNDNRMCWTGKILNRFVAFVKSKNVV